MVNQREFSITDKLVLNLLIFLFFLFYFMNSYFQIEQIKLFYLIGMITFYVFGIFILVNQTIILKTLKIMTQEEKAFVMFLIFSFITTPVNSIIWGYYEQTRYIWFLITLMAVFSVYLILLTINLSFNQLCKLIFFSFLPIIIVSSFKAFQVLSSGLFIRIGGGYVDPNGACIALLLYISIGIILLLQTKVKLMKLFYLIFTILGIMELAATFSRGGLIGFLVFLLSFFVIWRAKIYKKLFLLFVIIFMASLFHPLFANYTKIMSARFDIFNNPIEYEDTMSKIREIQAGVYLIEQKPFVLPFGTGFGSTQFEWFSHYFPSNSPFTAKIHNTPFAILIEDGIIGLVLIFIMFLRLIKQLIAIKENINRSVILSLMLGEFAISLSVWTLYLLPFWIAVYFLPRIYLKSLSSYVHIESYER